MKHTKLCEFAMKQILLCLNFVSGEEKVSSPVNLLECLSVCMRVFERVYVCVYVCATAWVFVFFCFCECAYVDVCLSVYQFALACMWSMF